MRMGSRLLFVLAALPGVIPTHSLLADDPTTLSRRLKNGALVSLGSLEDKNRSHGVYGAVFSPNGALVATRSTDARVRIWNAVTGKMLSDFEPYEEGRIKDLAFSRDSKMVATISADLTEQAALWNISTGKAIHKWNCTGDIIRQIQGETGFRIVDRDAIREVSLDGNVAITPLRNNAGIADFVFADQTDLETKNSPYSGNAIIFAQDVSPLSERSVLFAVKNFENQTFPRNFDSKLDGRVAIGRFSNSGRYAVAGTRSDSRILFADLANTNQNAPIDLRVNGIDSVAFSPDERHLLVAKRDGSAVILETLTRKEIARFPGIGERIFCVNFSPDGRWLVTGHSGSRENRAVIWDFRKTYLTSVHLPDTGDLHRAAKSLEALNARVAYEGISRLVEQPQEAVEILRQILNLEPEEAADTSQFDKLVTELDASKFEVREAAYEKLVAMRSEVKERLGQALEDASALETRIRLRKILELKQSLIPGEGSRAGQRRALRSVHLLELIDNEEAREMLTRLSQLEVDREVADAANAAISRLR